MIEWTEKFLPLSEQSNLLRDIHRNLTYQPIKHFTNSVKEVTQSLIHKRRRPNIGARPSLLAQPVIFGSSGEGSEWPYFDHQPLRIDQSLPPYGQASSSEDCNSSQSEKTSVKRRRLRTNYSVMPQNLSTTEAPNSLEKDAHLTRFRRNSGHGQQLILPRWAGPLFPQTQTLTQFPRRVVEMMCGPCDIETDQADGMRRPVFFYSCCLFFKNFFCFALALAYPYWRRQISKPVLTASLKAISRFQMDLFGVLRQISHISPRGS